MTSEEITKQLEAITHSGDDFVRLTYQLTEAWTAALGGIETVEPILRFMEAHPDIDYGAPGPLVHNIETFYQKGYEQKLVESVERTPTSHTLWMLNRVINGAKDIAVRRQLIAVMERARLNPRADEDAIQEANHFLERLGT